MTHYGPPQGQPDPYGQQPLPPPQNGQPYPPPPYGHQQPAPWATKNNWAGITGLVLGIVALVAAALWPVPGPGFMLGLLAVIFSGVGLAAASAGTASNRSVSGAGMASGLLAIGAVIYVAVIAV